MEDTARPFPPGDYDFVLQTKIDRLRAGSALGGGKVWVGVSGHLPQPAVPPGEVRDGLERGSTFSKGEREPCPCGLGQ